MSLVPNTVNKANLHGLKDRSGHRLALPFCSPAALEELLSLHFFLTFRMLVGTRFECDPGLSMQLYTCPAPCSNLFRNLAGHCLPLLINSGVTRIMSKINSGIGTCTLLQFSVCSLHLHLSVHSLYIQSQEAGLFTEFSQ